MLVSGPDLLISRCGRQRREKVWLSACTRVVDTALNSAV